MAWRRVGRGGCHRVGRSLSFQTWVSARVCQSISVSICLQRFFSSLDADGDGALSAQEVKMSKGGAPAKKDA